MAEMLGCNKLSDSPIPRDGLACVSTTGQIDVLKAADKQRCSAIYGTKLFHRCIAQTAGKLNESRID